jgi:hypothetical protein
MNIEYKFPRIISSEYIDPVISALLINSFKQSLFLQRRLNFNIDKKLKIL